MLGRRLARTRPGPSEALSVVYLQGDLGAGKTTLARGFLRECGVTGPVRSPTYALVQVYELAGLTVAHLDLYRVQTVTEIEHLGLTEWARPGCLWLVEWPRRAHGQLPSADLTVRLCAGAAMHEVDIEPGTGAGEQWLRRLNSLDPSKRS